VPRNNFDDRDDSADFQMNDSAESRPLTFGELGVPGPLVRVLAADDKKTAFPIQADTLPDSLAGRDILGRGRTGSGKTLAFSIPLVTRLGSYDSFGEIAMEEFRKEIKRRKKASLEERRADDFLPHPRGLVLAPTRELANQINDVLMPLAQMYGMTTTTVYGGVRYARQIRDLRAGADIVVACPGRLEDLLEQHALTLEKVEVAVIDEADEMADMGFLPPVKRLLGQISFDAQIMLFSATLDHGVDEVVETFLSDPKVHSVDSATATVDEMTHHVFKTTQGNRHELVRTLASGKGRRILFTRTKFQTQKLAKDLTKNAPDMAELHGNLANVQKDLGELDAALAGFSHAIRLKPAQADTWHNLLLTLQYADHARAADCAHWHRAFAEQFEAPWRGRVAAHPNSREPERRLRVGWVSADFCNHSVSYFTLPLLQALAARPDLGLELYGYSQVLVHDPLSKQLEACCTKWRHVLGLNDDELEDCIRRDQIDILIDLSGHTANNRLPVFARKPAPVQVGWLGYPDSSGLTHIDWRITDRHGDPEGADEYYSEKLWRLPEVFCCYRPMIRFPEKRQHPDYAVWPTPALETGYLTFGCCNNIAKLTPTTLKLWAKVLHAVPNSRLLLELAGLEQSTLSHKLLADFAALDVPAERLQLIHRDRAWQYRRYQQIDIALDPFPANGGTSSCDVLWMGVPLVTLSGERFVSRLGASLLHAVGHPEWIAHTAEEYVQIAQRLAADVPALNAIREGLRAETEASPLMDEAGFAEVFAGALRGMWREWCK